MTMPAGVAWSARRAGAPSLAPCDRRGIPSKSVTERVAVVLGGSAESGARLASVLDGAGVRARQVASVDAAALVLQGEPVDVLVVETAGVGESTLPELLQRAEGVPVLVLGTGGAKAALAAIRAGAADFVEEPWTPEEVQRAVRAVLAESAGEPEQAPQARVWTDGIVGESKSLNHVHDLVRRVASGNVTVLVRGESGTGKELVARSIHAQSDRGSGPFIKIHCAALPDALLESELFGYEKGAFTGATSRKPGRVELAESGTLFLDEIGDITPAMQVKLLRLLQDYEYERLGGTVTLRADVRFVAATHRDLEQMIRSGAFREDLFYRLNVVPIWLPPLRARREDVPMLATHFCARFATSHKKHVVLGDDAIAALKAERWPGNVRQLQNFIERLVVLSETGVIAASDVRQELAPQAAFSTQSSMSVASVLAGPASVAAPSTASGVTSLDAAVRDAERRAIERALKHAAGNRTLAARLLGVSRATLYTKLEELGIAAKG
jgi:two-component system, NtrC family, response regulator AtoC